MQVAVHPAHRRPHPKFDPAVGRNPLSPNQAYPPRVSAPASAAVAYARRWSVASSAGVDRSRWPRSDRRARPACALPRSRRTPCREAERRPRSGSSAAPPAASAAEAPRADPPADAQPDAHDSAKLACVPEGIMLYSCSSKCHPCVECQPVATSRKTRRTKAFRVFFLNKAARKTLDKA